MAEASLKLGGSWATKEGSLLGFNDQNGNYKPIPFDFTRATTATRVNRNGLIEEVQAGVPRIDFTGDGSLLLEPQRSNLITQSENMGATEWAGSSATRDITIIETSEINPEGLAISWKIQGLNSNNQLAYIGSTTIGTTLTNSIYVKRISGNGDIRLRDVNNSGTDFSLTVADGWKRIDVTATATSTTARFYINLVDYNDEVLVWGAQQEQGSYATSLIKTSGSAVTRNLDNCAVTGSSDLIGQTEGTMFFEGSVEHTPENVSIMNFDRSTQFSIVFIKQTNDKILARVYNGGSVIIGITSEAISGNFKCAVAYKSGDTAFYVNGTQIGIDTTTFTPAAGLDDIYIGSYSSPYFAYDHPVECNQALVFKTRLTNEELAALTTI